MKDSFSLFGIHSRAPLGPSSPPSDTVSLTRRLQHTADLIRSQGLGSCSPTSSSIKSFFVLHPRLTNLQRSRQTAETRPEIITTATKRRVSRERRVCWWGNFVFVATNDNETNNNNVIIVIRTSTVITHCERPAEGDGSEVWSVFKNRVISQNVACWEPYKKTGGWKGNPHNAGKKIKTKQKQQVVIILKLCKSY